MIWLNKKENSNKPNLKKINRFKRLTNDIMIKMLAFQLKWSKTGINPLIGNLLLMISP